MEPLNATLDVSAAPRGRDLSGAAGWAAVAAALCGVHCLLTPVLVTVLPFLSVAHAAEWWVLAGTVIVGGAVTALGPGRSRNGVLALLVLGAGIWAASLAGAFEPLPEALTSPIGSVTFAAGMLLSARICRRGECEICEA